MRILVSIDDTDDAESKGTGEIAEIIAAELADKGLAHVGRVTRHQLLIHPDIAYTSHNSSMCFEANIAEEALAQVIESCAAMLKAESVATADPGLAVVVPERLSRPERLMAYGRRAKEYVITKDEAYAVAHELGVHLSEHGGTGIGVIGALAGAGLKMTGNDGRFKGKFQLRADEDGVATVAEIRLQDVDDVRTLGGEVLSGDARVVVGAECKLILRDGLAILMVEPSGVGTAAPWAVVDRKALRAF
jgi:phage tail protein X